MNNCVLKHVSTSVFLFFIFSTATLASELSAELVWSKRLILSTTETGVVDQVLATAGQKIKTGEVVLNLDAREFNAARDQAAAKLLAAKTAYDEAKREAVRAQDLFERTMISEHDLQIEKNKSALAKANYLEAKAVLQKAELALERSRIVAPYNSLVLSVNAQPGQTVVSSLKAVPLAVIAESGYMIARAWLSLSDVAIYTKSKARSVKVENKQFNVISQYIVQEPNDKGLYAIDVTFETADASLHAGQTATIIFP